MQLRPLSHGQRKTDTSDRRLRGNVDIFHVIPAKAGILGRAYDVYCAVVARPIRRTVPLALGAVG